ncbi:hypothetical protein LAC1533_1643 [Ligilactobacillus acidipiscis]|uniref:Uncharacterized protein n=1 Tax=Ligilactobacillus acidipiscis TaxID=89059 RepID=A0A1K1KQF8_9LACO|nr:hypothetical protein LAC1533_1643 [Ligilactobacillus acidipiscis]
MVGIVLLMVEVKDDVALGFGNHHRLAAHMLYADDKFVILFAD